jgi:hypothetical protein
VSGGGPEPSSALISHTLSNVAFLCRMILLKKLGSTFEASQPLPGEFKKQKTEQVLERE